MVTYGLSVTVESVASSSGSAPCPLSFPGMPTQAWVTLIVGLVAVVGVLVTWRQKNTADRRSEWWRRLAWAYERTFEDDPAQQELGWKLIAVLMDSPLATVGDSDIVQVVGEHIALSSLGEEGEGSDGEEDDDDLELQDVHDDPPED